MVELLKLMIDVMKDRSDFHLTIKSIYKFFHYFKSNQSLWSNLKISTKSQPPVEMSAIQKNHYKNFESY